MYMLAPAAFEKLPLCGGYLGEYQSFGVMGSESSARVKGKFLSAEHSELLASVFQSGDLAAKFVRTQY